MGIELCHQKTHRRQYAVAMREAEKAQERMSS
jgi:hypothetical protein